MDTHTETDLRCSIGGLALEHPIMNAAGTCKHTDGDMGVQTIARSAAAAVVVGSITMNPREGNTGGTVYAPDPKHRWSINALGMPNPGAEYYRQRLSAMKEMANRNNKPLIVSVAADSAAQYVDLTTAMFAAGADGVELNFGCPNVIEKGKHEPIVSFDTGLVFRILLSMRQSPAAGKPIGVKLSPFSDPQLLERVADVIADSGVVRWITTSNTFPKAITFDESGSRSLAVAGGYGGYAGAGYKPIALGQVAQLRAFLPKEIDIIGVGGISTARDVLDFQRAGASAVQMATMLLNAGPGIISEIIKDIIDPIEGGKD